MFSGKKAGFTVLMIYSGYRWHQAYVEEELSVDASLLLDLWQVYWECSVPDYIFDQVGGWELWKSRDRDDSHLFILDAL